MIIWDWDLCKGEQVVVDRYWVPGIGWQEKIVISELNPSAFGSAPKVLRFTPALTCTQPKMCFLIGARTLVLKNWNPQNAQILREALLRWDTFAIKIQIIQGQETLDVSDDRRSSINAVEVGWKFAQVLK